MRKRRCLLAGLVVCLQALRAATQIVCALGPGASSYKASADERPTADTMQLVNRVNAAAKAICASTCPAVGVFRNTTAAEAMFIAETNQGKLAYAPRFFASVHESYGDAGIIAIIAHEFGHALDDAMGAGWIKKSWTPEQRADSWAGCVLASSDLSAKDMRPALAALAMNPPPSELNWNSRLPVIRSGYVGCGGTISRFVSDAGSGGK
jgi:hypothetical protein